MSGEINWRQKYQELKSKYMNAVDMAFRLGVEEGMKQGQLDNANQQLAQAQSQMQAQGTPAADPAGGKPNNNGMPGTPDQGGAPDKSGAPSVQPTPAEGAAPAAPMKESEHPEGSELDQHIAKLESMISKTEDLLGQENLDVTALNKTISDIKSLQKSYKEQLELKKSAEAISNIAKAMHKPQFKFGVQAEHNLSSSAKASVNMQQEIVQDVFRKWEEEEKKAGKDILSTLKIENIIKD